MYLCVVVVTCTGIIVSKISSKPNEDTPEEKEEGPIPVYRWDEGRGAVRRRQGQRPSGAGRAAGTSRQ